jgi:glutathione synthase
MNDIFEIGFVIDPWSSLKWNKDSSVAMMRAALNNGWRVWVMEMLDVYWYEQCTMAHMSRVQYSSQHELILTDRRNEPLHQLDAVFMRKDPPVDEAYLYTLFLLECAEHLGALVVNNPLALRRFNEKLCTLQFPDISPKSLLTAKKTEVLAFLQHHPMAVIKPLNSMGGDGIFLLRADDKNVPVIIEAVGKQGREFMLVQEYIPEIVTEGDKRILLIDGEPVPYGVRRVPSSSDHRGNMARGARAEGFELTAQDLEICRTIQPFLNKENIFFAGIDVIGNKLTEINITSPTGLVEISKDYPLDVAALLMEKLGIRIQLHRRSVSSHSQA